MPSYKTVTVIMHSEHGDEEYVIPETMTTVMEDGFYVVHHSKGTRRFKVNEIRTIDEAVGE